MSKKTGNGDVLRCSFCNKSQRDVKKLIAGPTVYICDECVDICLDIIAEDRVLETAGSGDQAPQAQGDQGVPRRVRDRAGPGQEEARRRGLQPLQADRLPREEPQARRRAPEVQHPPDRPDRHRQDAPRPDPGQAALGAVHDRRRHDPDRGRLRRRGRREHHPEALPGGRQRQGEDRARHRLHRRGGQDRPQGREPLDHPRRLGRGRAAGAPEDPRGHGRQRAAAGRAQAPAPGVHPDRHDEHPLPLRRRLRRPRGASSAGA